MEGGWHRARWFDPGCIAAACLAHSVLGAALIPQWMFTKYPDAAALLSSGQLGPESVSDFSPLYLWLNVALAPGVLRGVQVALGCVLLLCLFELARGLAGRLAGHLALWLGALAVPFLLYEATLEPDLPIAVLNCASLTLLLRAVGPGPRTLPLLAGAGALLGLSAAMRPAALALLGVVALWLCCSRAVPDRKLRMRALGLFLAAGIVAMLVPSGLLRLRSDFQLRATMSVGAVVHMGNRPESTGLGAQPVQLIKLYELQLRSRERPDYAHALYRQFARLAEGRELSPWETERFWLEKSLAFVRLEPGAFVRMQLRKVLFFLLGPEAHDVGDVVRAEKQLGGLPLVPGRLLIVLGLAGLGWGLVRRRTEVVLLLLVIGASLALGCMFYVVSRYRLGVLPLWVACAGAFGAWLVESRRDRHELARGAACLVLPLLFLVAFHPLAEMGRVLERGASASANGAELQRARKSGRLDEATRLFIEDQAAQPYITLVRSLRGVPFESRSVAAASARRSAERFGEDYDADTFVLATLAQRAGHCEEALPHALALAEVGFRNTVFDHSLDPALLAARCLKSLGRDAEARAAAADSVEQWPGTVDGLALAAVAEGEGFTADPQAGGPRTQRLFALHDPLNARWALARARLEWKDLAGALAEADLLVEKLPDVGVVHGLRARVLGMLGRSSEAVEAFGKAVSLFPDYGHPTRGLERAFDEQLSAADAPPKLLSLGVEYLLRRGELQAAVGLLTRAQPQWQQQRPTREHLERLQFLRGALPAGYTVEP